jgi:hypothetical protein
MEKGISERVSNDLLCEAKYDCLDVMELFGSLVGQLREAVSDSDADNDLGAIIVCDDVLLTFAELESKLGDMAAKVAKWKTWVEEVLP